MESNSSPVDRAASVITNIFLAAVVLLYLGFVGIGNWSADEYDDFGRLAQEGWHEVWRRLQWSPRPFSEPLFLACGWAVNELHRPLIIPFLLLLWAMFLAAGLLTYWQERRDRDAQAGAAGIQLSLALMASFVSGGIITEVFYWPAGAVECLPTVAAALLLFLQTVHGRLSTVSGRRVACLCLLVAGCSSEMGAGFVLVYAAFQMLGRVTGKREPHDDESRKPILWWITPALVALLVLLALMTHRLRLKEQPIEHAPAALGLSLVGVGARAVVSEMFGVVVRPEGGLVVNSRFLSEVLLALGIALCWSRMQKSRQVSRDAALLSAALLVSSILTIAASELQFHAVCCQRHETVRRCWVLVGFAGLAIAIVGSRWKESSRPRTGAWLASLLICAGIIVAWHTRPMLREYRIYGNIYSALDHNFRSGFASEQDPMTFLLIPQGGIIYQPQVPSGTYRLDDAPPPYVRYVLRFFNKRGMVVRSSEEWMNLDQPKK